MIKPMSLDGCSSSRKRTERMTVPGRKVVLGIFAVTVGIVQVGCGQPSGDGSSGRISIPAKNSSRGVVDSGGCDDLGTPYGGGTGKEPDPYLICSIPHLAQMASSSDPAYFTLTRDLDFTARKEGSLGTTFSWFRAYGFRS